MLLWLVHTVCPAAHSSCRPMRHPHSAAVGEALSTDTRTALLVVVAGLAVEAEVSAAPSSSRPFLSTMDHHVAEEA